MGCGAMKIDIIKDQTAHHLGIETAFDKNVKIDLTKNPNTRLLESTNFYREQKPEEGKEFDDDLFPPTNESLKGKDQLPIGKEKIEWKSAHQIWGEGVSIFGEGVSRDDFKLGIVKDSYFVAALTALCDFPSIIIQLFKTTTLPNDESGIQIYLRIEGVWTVYCIDDHFPVSKETGETLFCGSPTKHIWALLLEKAYAKASGGYASIINGVPRDIFRVFTPFCTIPIDVPKEDMESLWQNIKATEKNNCIMTATIKSNTPGVEDVGLVKNTSFNLVNTREEEIDGILYRMLRLRNPTGEGEWSGNYCFGSELWTPQLIKAFDYKGKPNPDDEDFDKNEVGIFYIEYEDFVRYFQYINIMVPLRPLSCQVFNIPKEQAAEHNVVKLKFEKKGVFSLSIERQRSRFHKDITEDKDVIENLILAKIDKEAKKLMCVDSCFNETLSTRVEPGEYLCEFCLDYKSSDLTDEDIRPYNVHVACTTDYKLKLVDPDLDLTLLKTIMVPKIESLQRYKQRFKEQFVSFTGNRFEATAYGFCYMKNQGKELKFLRPQFLMKNFKSIDGDLPKYLRMKEDSKFFFLYNRFKAENPFQTGINPGFYKEDTEGSEEPEVKEYADDKYFEDTNYKKAVISYTFEG